jgi:hypothetical protein
MLFTVKEIFLNKFSLSTYNKQYQENLPQNSSSVSTYSFISLVVTKEREWVGRDERGEHRREEMRGVEWGKQKGQQSEVKTEEGKD